MPSTTHKIMDTFNKVVCKAKNAISNLTSKLRGGSDYETRRKAPHGGTPARAPSNSHTSNRS